MSVSQDCPCWYVSCDKSEQIKELDLTSFDTVVVSSKDLKLFSDNTPNLVVEKDISSWQQTWLTRWREIQKMKELKARKKNSLSKKTSKKQRQLEM